MKSWLVVAALASATGSLACTINSCLSTEYCDTWLSTPVCKSVVTYTKRGVPCKFPFAFTGGGSNHAMCNGGECATTTRPTGSQNVAKTTGECADETYFCNDGVKNANEVGIDCGGRCPACPTPTCSDGERNGQELGIDCMNTGMETADCPVCDDLGESHVIQSTWPPIESQARRRLLSDDPWKNKGSAELSSVQIVVTGEVIPGEGLLTLARVDNANGNLEPEEEVTIQCQDNYVQKLYVDQAAFDIQYMQYEHFYDSGTTKTQLRFALPAGFPKGYNSTYDSSDKDTNLIGGGTGGTVDETNHHWFFEAEDTAFLSKRGRPLQLFDPIGTIVKPNATPAGGQKKAENAIWNFKVVTGPSCIPTCTNFDDTPYQCGNDGCGGFCPEDGVRGPFWDGTENEGCGPGRTCDATQRCKNTVEEDIEELSTQLSSLEIENQSLIDQLSALLAQLTIISGECGDVSSFGLFETCNNSAALVTGLNTLETGRDSLTSSLLSLPELEELSEADQDQVTVAQACVGLYDSFLAEFTY